MLNEQMTLEVGGEVGISLTGSFKIGGDLAALKELPKGADVRVVVTNEDGEIIATSLGHISALTFREHRKDGVKWTERRHAARALREEARMIEYAAQRFDSVEAYYAAEADPQRRLFSPGRAPPSDRLGIRAAQGVTAVELVDVVVSGRFTGPGIDVLDRAVFLAARLAGDVDEASLERCSSTDKVRHATEVEAKRFAVATRSRRRGRARGVTPRAYRCELCGGWHLTTRARRA